MSATHKKVKSNSPVAAVKKGARRVVKKAASRTGSALAVAAERIPSRRRVAKRANAKGLPGRTKELVTKNPVRILLGASVIAFGFVLAKLKNLV
jgi:hypothetical protein